LAIREVAATVVAVAFAGLRRKQCRQVCA